MKTLLRWQGGKSKHLKYILPFIKSNEVFIDLFGGGGNVILNVVDNINFKEYIYNDLNIDVVNFFKGIPNEKLYQICSTNNNDINNINLNDFDNANQFFIKNSCKFGGHINGTFSKLSFKQNFNKNKVDKWFNLLPTIEKIKVLNFDYKEIINCLANRNNITWYIDPPYRYKTKNLYGKYSDINIEELKELVDKIKGYVVISLDNCIENKELFKDYNQVEYEIYYSSTNKIKGKELLIIKENK